MLLFSQNYSHTLSTGSHFEPDPPYIIDKSITITYQKNVTISDLSGQKRGHEKESEFNTRNPCGPGAPCDGEVAREQRSAQSQASNCKPCQQLKVCILYVHVGHAQTRNMQYCGDNVHLYQHVRYKLSMKYFDDHACLQVLFVNCV